MSSFDGSDRATILVHFYRAMVGRADIWRMRMDATTNWAIGTTAAVISFALGNAELPHYAVLLASVLTLCFLMLEARRLTFYHLWQQRVLRIEQGMIRPALESAPVGGGFDMDDSLVAELAPELGRTAPTMSIVKAAARRLRRVYVYLFAVQWLAWGLKLASHPRPAATPGEIVARAGMAGVPGAFWLALSILALVGAVGVAFALGGVDRRRGRTAPGGSST